MSDVQTMAIAPTPTPLISLTTVQQAVVSAMVTSLKGLVQGATEDLQTFAQGIINDTMAAAAAGDTDTLDQIKDQAVLILEINRLRAAQGASFAVMKVVSTVLNAAIGLALAAAVK